MKSTLARCTGLLACLLICASSAAAADGWVGYGTITQLDSTNSVLGAIRGVIITTDAAIVTGSCTGGTPLSYFLPDDGYSTPNPQFNEEMAIIMGAYLNGRSVAFYVSGCYAPYGNPGWPKIGAIRVQ